MDGGVMEERLMAMSEPEVFILADHMLKKVVD